MSRSNRCAGLEVLAVLVFCLTLSAPALSQTSLEDGARNLSAIYSGKF